MFKYAKCHHFLYGNNTLTNEKMRQTVYNINKRLLSNETYFNSVPLGIEA